MGDFIQFVSIFGSFAFPAAILIAFFVSRSKYKNKSNAGAFFFENDQLVLNSAFPQPIPIDFIEKVELHYSKRELESRLSYSLTIKILKKDGKTKRVFYKGYRTAKLALPADMEAALREKGIPCVMVES